MTGVQTCALPIWKIDTTEKIDRDWIFIGEKTKQKEIKDIYREAVYQIPEWLNLPKNKNGVSFGIQAFRDWASDIEAGRYNSLDVDNFDDWKDYTIYVCNFATNSGGSKCFLDKALEYNPDLTFIAEIINQYMKTKELWNDLEAIGGAFNITLDTLQDIDKRKIISSKIREFAECMEKVVDIIKSEQQK